MHPFPEKWQSASLRNDIGNRFLTWITPSINSHLRFEGKHEKSTVVLRRSRSESKFFRTNAPASSQVNELIFNQRTPTSNSAFAFFSLSSHIHRIQKFRAFDTWNRRIPFRRSKLKLPSISIGIGINAMVDFDNLAFPKSNRGIERKMGGAIAEVQPCDRESNARWLVVLTRQKIRRTVGR